MNTPLLLIIFNRPHETKQVIDAIKKVRPSKIFIAADGPRDFKPNEKELCKQTRKIATQIDWPCEVHTHFQENNLGCKQRPISAINWFFEHVDEGIILEDDCIPDPTFFTFCTELLDYYRDNEKVMHISGNNFQDGILRGDKTSSYYFSKYTHSWGWATWKRAWQSFDVAVKDFPQYDKGNKIREVTLSRTAQNFWIKNFRHTIKGNDSWDSLWMYSVWYNNGMAILPQNNLVSNIGFNENATHTTKQGIGSKIRTSPIANIIKTDHIVQDIESDEYTFENVYHISIIKRFLLKVRDISK